MNSYKIGLSETTQQVLDGEFDPLEAYALMKDLKQHLDSCINQVFEIALVEADKFEGKQFQYKGINFEKRDGRANYNFKGISQWSEAYKKLKRIEEIAKASAKNGSISVDPDTGEQIDPCKITYSKPSLVVKYEG